MQLFFMFHVYGCVFYISFKTLIYFIFFMCMLVFLIFSFKTFGYGGGREDVWEPDQDVNWGTETEWLADNQRFKPESDRELKDDLAATHMVYLLSHLNK